MEIIPVLFVTIGFAIIGFLDDYIKVVMKRSMGLRAWQKLLGQILVTAIFGFYLVNFVEDTTLMLIPFSGGKYLDISYLFIPMLFLVVLGTVNGSNFTDGLDGLESSYSTSNLLYSCIHRYEQRYFADRRSSSRQLIGIFVI